MSISQFTVSIQDIHVSVGLLRANGVYVAPSLMNIYPGISGIVSVRNILARKLYGLKFLGTHTFPENALASISFKF